MEGCDVAQIYLNGHVINPFSQELPELNQKFCGRCGQATINQCQQCRNPIPGEYRGGGLIIARFPAPAFCIHCGASYPWTTSKLDAARELVQDSENLNAVEKDSLSRSLDDLVKDTPSTPVAANKWKKLMGKVGKETAGAFRDIFVDVASETAKKILWPS